MIRRVYVTQFGGWWSLTVVQWLGLILRSLKGDFEWDLDQIGHPLSYPPSRAVSTGSIDVGGRRRRWVYPRLLEVLAYNILDWTDCDWAEAMRCLLAAQREQNLIEAQAILDKVYSEMHAGITAPDANNRTDLLAMRHIHNAYVYLSSQLVKMRAVGPLSPMNEERFTEEMNRRGLTEEQFIELLVNEGWEIGRDLARPGANYYWPPSEGGGSLQR